MGNVREAFLAMTVRQLILVAGGAQRVLRLPPEHGKKNQKYRLYRCI